MAESHSKTKAQLLELLGGKGTEAKSEERFIGVEFDSRKVTPQNLFLAFQGEHTHGHEFIDKAFENGAALALIEDGKILESSKYADRLIVVEDTVAALNKLATEIRKECPTPTVAVTGSMGKTTVKALLKSILTEYGAGTAAVASFNNHIGVAYTICNSTPEDKWLALEMGMNHKGELQMLTHVGQPDVAIITAIAPVHMEFFESIHGITDAKLEIVEGIKPGGTLILNGDDEELLRGYNALIDKNEGKAPYTTKYFRNNQDADLRIQKITSKGFDGLEFDCALSDETISCKLQSVGSHNIQNAAAAVLACKTLIPEITSEQIQKGLLSFEAEKHRLNVITLSNGAKIVDDCYNANPEAVKAALDIVQDLSNSGTKTAVMLGDMAELGDTAEEYYKEVGQYASETKPGYVITVGEGSETISQITAKADINSHHFKTPEEAAEFTKKQPFDLLLVKASRAAALDKAVAILVKDI